MPQRHPRSTLTLLAALTVATVLAVATARTTAGADAPAASIKASPAGAPDPAASAMTPEQLKFFEMKVRPLIAQHCAKCHGQKAQKGKLRLDTHEGILAGGENGPVVVPGNPDQSKLIEAIRYRNKDLQMPPDAPLAPDQVDVLTGWIRMGAPWPANTGPISAAHRVRRITDENRAFWSFQPVRDPVVPQMNDNGWSRNAIDKFVFAKLAAEGLTAAPEADKVTLIRRATFDLHGLPPTPEEVAVFVNDSSPDAWSKLIERLLASPHYGERWARHWLDLARYAESDGYRQDAFRPNAWPYRDYVIKSFNDDKPYDRFVTEQLAGDEIAPENPDVLVATGFLRHGLYEYNQRDVRTQRSEIVNEVTDVTGDVFLGLSMGCARCHDHKFDPILQADYYRLQAFFTPILPRQDMVLASPGEKAAYAAKLRAWEEKTASIRAEMAKIEAPYVARVGEGQLKMFPPDIQVMMRKAPAQRTPQEHQLAELAYRQVYEQQANKGGAIKGPDRDRWAELNRKLGEFDSIRPRPLFAGLLATDVGPVAPPTKIPGHENDIAPGYLVVLDRQPLNVPKIEPKSNSTGRRTALAKWLTQPNHPLTTRVIANRVWQYHFGRGIVGTSSDYGVLGDKPTHPELLDYLARRFVENGWSFKQMHRLVMNSATYRQAGVRQMPEVARLKDPENRWLWKQNTRRLDAEQIRDAMLAVSGELKADMGGPSADTTAPRRTIYTKVIRNTRDPIMDVFDAPDAFASAASRNVTVTANQALLMINGQWPLQRAGGFAARLAKGGGKDPGRVVETAYHLAYGRAPTAAEKAEAVDFLKRDAKAADVIAATPGATESNPAAVQVATAGNGGGNTGDAMAGPLLKSMPQRGNQAILIRDGNPADMLRLPDSDSLPVNDFTIETFVYLESLYPNANVRTIVSQWTGNPTQPGWAFGVTSEKSKHQPRNLILQLVGTNKAGETQYEVIPSDLRVEPYKTYYLAVSVSLGDTSDAGVTFYLHDLTDNDFVTKVAHVPHKVTGKFKSNVGVVIGGRDAPPMPHGWDGMIDEIRISRGALTKDQLLLTEGSKPPAGAVAAHWQFEEAPGLLKDSAGVQKDLQRMGAKFRASKTSAGPSSSGQADAVAKSMKLDPALLDFCHVLLNSNEFLYVD
jgi:hypothetical protein